MSVRFRALTLIGFSLLLIGCQSNDDPLYAPWNMSPKPINNTDITAVAGNIATGRAAHAAYHDQYANSPKKCVTNPKNMDTVCTLVDPSR